MKYPSIIELNGKKYMNTQTAADAWSLKTSTVAKYCKDGKICNATKYLETRWYIPIDAVKPLSNDEVRRFLILTLQLKNKPSLEIDWSTFSIDEYTINAVYRYLVFQEFIENYNISDNKRIPYEIVLTQKGLELVTSNTKEEIKDFSTAMKAWLPTIIGAAQLIIQVTQMVA